jgi:hypothetical protein
MRDLVLSGEAREAVSECKRFLARVEALERKIGSREPGTHPVETAAVKRASLDLTRALAWMRQKGLTTWG